MNNLQKLHISLRENRKIAEENDFKYWLNSYYDENIKVYQQCNIICERLELICKNNGREINNKNQFKNEITTYLYYNNAMY